MATKTRSGKQELYPDNGHFLSSTRLAAIHAEARKDCLRLFHLLFDEFFSAEECLNAVAFGKHGKVPEGKAVLDKSKVDVFLSKYIAHLVGVCVFIHPFGLACFILQHFNIISFTMQNSWQLFNS